MRTWLKRAKDPDTLNHRVYAAFAVAVKKAEAEAEAAMVHLICAAAPDTWQAAAWWLERKNPKEWGKVNRTHLSADTGSNAPTDLVIRIGGKPYTQDE